MSDQLTIDSFLSLVGDTFHLDEIPHGLRLDRVAAVMESERARLQRQPFSLYFHGPPEPLLPQRIYALSHDSFLDPLLIFIVPVNRLAEGIEYEAVFT